MKEWFLGLEPRERWMVGATGIFLALVILYVGIIEPVYNSTAERQARVEQKRDDLAWLQTTAAQIAALRGTSATPAAGGSNESPVVVITRTAREAGLDAPTRTQPVGKEVRVTFRSQPFDKLVVWLATLQQRHGMVIASASFDRANAPGIVNATLTLERR